jgi:hypothetical protein
MLVFRKIGNARGRGEPESPLVPGRQLEFAPLIVIAHHEDRLWQIPAVELSVGQAPAADKFFDE